MEYVVDRIEGLYVVAEDEDENIITIMMENIEGRVKEGDVIKKRENNFYIDEKATIERRKSIDNMMKGMWN